MDDDGDKLRERIENRVHSKSEWLYLFSKARDRDAELFAVFSDRSASDLVRLFSKNLDETFVGEGVFLVLGVDSVLEDHLDLSGADVVAVGVLKFLGEEVLERVDAEGRLDVLTIGDAGDSGHVEARLVGDILEDHRLELLLVAVDKVFTLVVEDSLHDEGESVVALLDSVDEPLSGLHLFADVGDGVSLFLRLVAAVDSGLAEHVGVGLTDTQFWLVTVVEVEGELFSLVVDDEVWNDVLSLTCGAAAVGATRFRVEVENLLGSVS